MTQSFPRRDGDHLVRRKAPVVRTVNILAIEEGPRHCGADLFAVAGAFSIATNIFQNRFSSDGRDSQRVHRYLHGVSSLAAAPQLGVLTSTWKSEANQLTFFNFPVLSEAAFNLTCDTDS